MEMLMIARDRQEFQAADVNNIEAFVDQAMANVVMDAITTERMFVGMAVTLRSATEIDVAPGRLWDGTSGKRYRHAAAEAISLFSYLPVTDQKYLNISVIGQEINTDQEPRDYLVDLTSGQTEPKSVYMTTARQVAIQITAGLESTTPQKPDAPTSYLTIAHVLLGPSGIVTIELANNKALMRLYDVYQDVLQNVAWINAIEGKLASLTSDLANLANLARANSVSPLLTEIAGSVALLNDKLALPSAYQAYAADGFATSLQSDTANADYHALVLFGLRFPWGGETEQGLSLFNPYETVVKNYSGLILPDHDIATRMRLSGQAGELMPSQYQYQTTTYREMTRTVVRTVYGPSMLVNQFGQVLNWEATPEKVVEQVFEGTVPEGVTLGDKKWTDIYGETHTGFYNGDPNRVLWTRYTRTVYQSAWNENYTVLDSITRTINGSLAAQTYLSAQNGWLCSIGLTFTKKADTGSFSVLVCDTLNGLPNLQRTLGVATVQPGDIQSEGETLFQFTQPVFLQSGGRYAFVLITGGAHCVALVEGTDYSQGTLFYSTDGEYFQGDFTKDLMMSLNFAKFKNIRTVIDLRPISLSDGIAAFDYLQHGIVPDATSFVLQYQPSGSGDWADLALGDTDGLLGLPAMCRLRAVFNGTQDIMPGIDFGTSKLRATRPDLTMMHISTEQTLEQPSTHIQVTLKIEGWDPARHTCEVVLLSGSNTHAGTVSDVTLDTGVIRRTVDFALTDPGISSFKVQISGTTDNALIPFVVDQRMHVAL